MNKELKTQILDNRFVELLRAEMAIDQNAYVPLCAALKDLAKEWQGASYVDKEVVQRPLCASSDYQECCRIPRRTSARDGTESRGNGNGARCPDIGLFRFLTSIIGQKGAYREERMKATSKERKKPMKIIDEREAWIHTNFFVDSALITPQEQRLISMQVEPELRQMGIQYGLHYEKSLNPEHSIIVLECIPFEKTREAVKALINETIKDFPSRSTKTPRNVVTSITVEDPESA